MIDWFCQVFDLNENTRYHGRPVSSTQELMPLEYYLFNDLRLGLDCHVMYKSLMPDFTYDQMRQRNKIHCQIFQTKVFLTGQLSFFSNIMIDHVILLVLGDFMACQ